MEYSYRNELYHHGIKGQKWGVRRYQNEDGSLTKEGKERYGINANNWMSAKGKTILKSDREEQDVQFRNEIKNLSRNDQIREFHNYLRENNGEVWKNLQKQEALEDAYKDYKQIVKSYKEHGEKAAIGINRYGQLILMTLDDLTVKRMSDKGYNIVNNFDDVMSMVNVKDIRYGNLYT